MKKALLIGINDYPCGDALSGCVEDVKSLHSVLERNGDGSKNFDIKDLLNVQTSREAMHAIEDLVSGDEEIAVLYFSTGGGISFTRRI